MSRPRLVIALLVSVSLVAGCSSSSTGADAPEPPTPVSAAATMTGPTTAAQPTPAAPAATAAPAPTMALVGDIASCSTDTDEQVAALIGPDVSVIGLLGDTVYDHGSPGEFARCFEPAWAPLLPRVRPAPGNHDYGTHDAAGYFAFFGAAAGEPGRGWYSYDVGTWHVVALNSNCSAVGGCDVGSPQGRWLRDDLTSHASAPCTLAYWHHARFSSGMHGDVASVEPLWRTVHEMGVDVVFAGHDHHYERFAPLSVNGEPDPAGVVSFIVGTGGASAYRIDARRHAGSEVALAHTFGVVEVELGPGTYTTRFLAIPDGRVLDEFTGTCR